LLKKKRSPSPDLLIIENQKKKIIPITMAYMERVMTKLQKGTKTRRRRQGSEVATQTNTQKDDGKSSDSESTYLMHPEQAYGLASNSVKLQN
jgi:hypothetical protein